MLNARQAKPHRYSYVTATVSNEQQDSLSVTEVKSLPDKLKWEKTMETEMRPLQLNRVWELVVKLIHCAIETW